MEDPSSRDIQAIVEGPATPLDVSRECELAVELWKKGKENDLLLATNEKLRGQVKRCETALKKCNALIDEYVRRVKQKDRIVAKSESEVEEIRAKLLKTESSRAQMARTFGKHRQAHIDIERKMVEMANDITKYKHNATELDTNRRNEISEIKKNLKTTGAEKDIEHETFTNKINELILELKKQKDIIDDQSWKLQKSENDCKKYKKIADDCEANIPNTVPYKELGAKFGKSEEQVAKLTEYNALLVAQCDHLKAENNHVVSFALAEGLEIPNLSAAPTE